jgi:DNA-binding PadR family transcriptional regulator
MYPLLRDLEARGLVAGEWEHPERRSRRFYALTDAGAAERERLRGAVAPRLDAVALAVVRLRDELA